MGWVKEQFEHDRLLDKAIGEAWCAIRLSLDTAACEYCELEIRPGVEIHVGSAGDNFIVVVVESRSDRFTAQISLDRKRREIECRRADLPENNHHAPERLCFGFVLRSGARMNPPGMTVEEFHHAMPTLDGKAVTIEEACRAMIEPLLP